MDAITIEEEAEIAALAGELPGITAAELGVYLGLTPARVNGLAREGRIPRRDNGTFTLKPAVRAYVDSIRTRGSALQANPELNAEKVRLARESADKIAFANARARGELLDAREVATAWRGVIVDLRAALLAVPSRVAANLGLDRKETVALDSEIREAMEAIANDD